MRGLRIVARLAVLLPWILLGLVAVIVIYPMTSLRAHGWMNRQWSRVLLKLCGIQTTVTGRPVLAGPVLFVANHVSWVDIFIMNAVRPTAFIAKEEIRSWPVVGRLVAGADTLFIARGQRRAVHAVAQAMKARFDQGRAVGLFPEGTTSDGLSVLPFHAGLFESVRFAGASVQPLALDYHGLSSTGSFPAFIGEETLVSNVLRLLGEKRWPVRVHYQAPIAVQAGSDQEDDVSVGPTRFELAEQAFEAVRQGLQLPPDTRD